MQTTQINSHRYPSADPTPSSRTAAQPPATKPVESPQVLSSDSSASNLNSARLSNFGIKPGKIRKVRVVKKVEKKPLKGMFEMVGVAKAMQHKNV